MRIRSIIVSVVGLLAAGGCGVHGSGQRHSSIAVSASGRIGPLRIDRSGRVDIVRFAGRPDAEREGSAFGAPPYDAIGYGCRATPSKRAFPLVYGTEPSCRTVFWVDRRSGTLEDFFTSDPRYVEKHGIRVGTTSEQGGRRLHRRLILGCEENMYVAGAGGDLTIAFEGGTAKRTSGPLVVHGARVFALVLHSRRRGSGAFDCL